MQFNNKTDQQQARIRYQLRHFDMMGDFGNAWAVVVSSGTIVGPTDVSADLAAYIRKIPRHPHDRDNYMPDHFWREPEPTKEQ